MNSHNKLLTTLGMIALLITLVACSVPGSGNTMTPTQQFASSVAAMQKIKSVHVNLQTTVSLSGSGSNNVTYSLTGQGDAVAPDQVSLSLFAGSSSLLSLVSTGDKVYVQVKGGSWLSFTKEELKDAEQSFFTQSLATRLSEIMGVVENAQLTDHGQESINGENLDHITATLDDQTLQTLTSQLSALVPSQAQSSLNQLKKASLDVWLDTSTSYVHVARLDVVTNVDASALSKFTGQQIPATGALPIELVAQVTFSKFNAPVTIQAPQV